MIILYQNNYYYDSGDEIEIIFLDEPLEPTIQGPSEYTPF